MIKEAFAGALSGLRKALGQDLVKQYTNPAPKNKYACFFTAFYMYFRTVHGLKMGFAEYKAAAMKIGACGEDFTIKDRSKMADAAGVPELVCCDTSYKLREKNHGVTFKRCPGAVQFERRAL